MGSRLELHDLLVDILGSRNVYFQPPESIKLQYPAIVYSKSNIDNRHADDRVYKQTHSYSITVIDKNPDSDIVNKMSMVPRIRFDRNFVSDNLNHNVFTLIY